MDNTIILTFNPAPFNSALHMYSSVNCSPVTPSSTGTLHALTSALHALMSTFMEDRVDTDSSITL